MSSGRLITIEGIDGAGKSTLAVALEAELRTRGVPVELLREPGGVRAAERIRELVKDPDLHIDPRAEALLFAAARAQLVEDAVKPLLRDGTWVLLDRFVDSSLAYQGGGRRLGIETIREINEFAIRGLRPDRTLLLVVDTALGRGRLGARARPLERLEREQEDFFRRTAGAYLELLAEDPTRIKRIDGSAPPDRVLAAALEAISDLL
ncbi:MAG: dTMP kinase [Solirubrobacterales bacterium]|nr:dTMP kinase [Solirubrobacterales bacterium]MBV9800479.1 dTMP kinase [Solirubrobacterales bacterium]